MNEEQRRRMEAISDEVENAKKRLEEITEEMTDVDKQLSDAGVDSSENARQQKKAEVVENLKRIYPGVVNGKA